MAEQQTGFYTSIRRVSVISRSKFIEQKVFSVFLILTDDQHW